MHSEVKDQEYIINIEHKNVQPFEEVDPFNPSNTLKGYIKRDGSLSYGLMYITHVNGRGCSQHIWCTPKMSYPFKRDGVYKQIKRVDYIEVYTKLDGTNILGYTYQDADGSTYVSYKTRLRPFLGTSKFGAFADMWREMLKKYPMIPKLILDNGCNISFELYGKRNKILVEYETLLDVAVLFGVYPHRIVSPSDLVVDGVPIVKQLESFQSKKDFVANYEELRMWLNSNISKDKTGMVRGVEGAVWYMIAGGAIQWKCKPDLVLDVHWKSDKIPYHSIYISVVNAYEEVDMPSFELIKSLLLEEFEESKIYKAEERIRKIMAEVAFEKKFKAELKGKYLAEGLDIVGDKRTCMRFFGSLYSKRAASKVYNYLMEEFGGNTEWK
jgi:hypothetical protein